MKRYILFTFLCFLFACCKGQENPKHIGKAYGEFDMDKITFDENLDSLFLKTDFFIIVKKDSYFDTIKNKQIWTDTLDYTYRIPHEKATGLYTFKNIKIKDEVVSFYSDRNKKFRKADFSVYISTKEYKQLLAETKDYKDITTPQVKKFNGDKYIILQKKDSRKQTNLYCSKNDDGEGDYFVRVRINDLRIKGDKFDIRYNSEFGP